MNVSFHRLFASLLLSTAVAGSIFLSQAPAKATLQLTCDQTVSIWSGGLGFDATGEAFNGYPFTVQNLTVQLYDGATLESTTYASTTTSSPEWIVSSVPFPSGDTGGTGYTLKVTDTSVTPNVSISMPLWSPPETYEYTVYTSSSSGFAIVLYNGTNGIPSSTMWISTSPGGMYTQSASGTVMGGYWTYNFTGLSAATSYYWGLSSTSCSIGVSTCY